MKRYLKHEDWFASQAAQKDYLSGGNNWRGIVFVDSGFQQNYQ